MNKILQKIILFVLIIVISSCSRTYKIDKEDFKLIPYSGTENLIFISSEKELDTIFLKGFDQYQVDSDPLAIFPNKFEIYRLVCKHSDPNPKYDRYLENGSLMELHSSPGSQASIEFNISLKGTMGSCNLSKKEFDKIPTTSLLIENKNYTDIKIFTADIYIKGKLPEKYFWSVSEGLVGINDNGIEWRLIKKYVP